LQLLPAGVPATRVKIEKDPYVSMYGPTHLPNPRTPHLFPTPIPTRDPAAPPPLFFRNRRRRICLAGAGAVGGGGQARRRCSAGWTTEAGTRRTSAVGISLHPVAGRRLHGTLARQRPTPPGRPAVFSFVYSLTLLTVPLESDRIPELIMIHPLRPFFLLFTHTFILV
jgi:hypothetical protein